MLRAFGQGMCWMVMATACGAGMGQGKGAGESKGVAKVRVQATSLRDRWYKHSHK
jgi:hypothetical protein